MLQPTKYKVSTITATGKLNTLIDLPTFYQEAELVPFESRENGFVYIEYGIDKESTIFRGFNKKLLLPKKKKKKDGKRFDNQVTVILRYDTTQYVNVKVFKNGNVQMTGVKHIDRGEEVILKVEEQVRKIHLRGIEIAKTFMTLAGDNYKVCLINSDFRMGMQIRRDRLNKIVQTEYKIYSSFEPCTYPGVKILYCWNSDHGDGDGVCKCSCECKGKGTGRGEGQCKNITIAVFQSGCIIITGAQMYKQIDEAYQFICTLIQKHVDTLRKTLPVLAPTPALAPAPAQASGSTKGKESSRKKATVPKLTGAKSSIKQQKKKETVV